MGKVNIGKYECLNCGKVQDAEVYEEILNSREEKPENIFLTCRCTFNQKLTQHEGVKES